MNVATIIVLIDIQNGFSIDGLTLQQGGSLYVPEGEIVGTPAANLIRNMSDATIILSQDFHPANHVSFFCNHENTGPFAKINLKLEADGLYHVTKDTTGSLEQTLWWMHCVQKTDSALFVTPIMAALPANLRTQIGQHVSNPVLEDSDNRRNKFYVIRKGMRSDLDSYGIATENDGISTTAAPKIFKLIADQLKNSGATAAKIYIGGLATNFCLEFSHNDLYKYLVPYLQEQGIKANVSLLTDISRGVPIAVPGGAWPDLAASSARMAARGTVETTTSDLIRSLIIPPSSLRAKTAEPKL